MATLVVVYDMADAVLIADPDPAGGVIGMIALRWWQTGIKSDSLINPLSGETNEFILTHLSVRMSHERRGGQYLNGTIMLSRSSKVRNSLRSLA